MNKFLARLNPLGYRSTIRSDIFITVVNGIGVIIGVLLLYGLIARAMGMDALGEFLLVRRTSLTLMGILLLGMNLGLPYYISKEEDNIYGAAALLLFGLLTIPLIAFVSGTLYLGVLSGFPRELALPFFIFAAGYAMQFLVYSLLRGHLNILGANLVHILSTGLIPLGVFVLLHERNISHLLTAIGLGVLILSMSTYLIKMGRGSYIADWRKIVELLVYGVQRIPSSLAYFVLLGGVPLLILSDVRQADIAYVNSGISLLRLFLVVVGPIGIVLLPRVSKALAAGQRARIERGLDVLGRTVLLIGVPLALFLSVNSSALLSIWLGSEGAAGAGVVRLIVLALPFYLLMVVLRSPIDAASAKGYNSITYGAAAVVLLLTFYGLKVAGLMSVTAGGISFIAGHVTAAIGSGYYAHKFYGINLISPWYLVTVLGAVIIFSLFFYSVNALTSGIASLLIGGIALVTALSLFFLKSRSEWIVDLRSLVTVR